VTALNKLADANLAVTAASRGSSTTEFKGKTVVQLLVIAGAVVTHFVPEVGIDQETAIAIVAGMEALYTLSRTVLKAFLSRAQKGLI